MSAPRPLFLPDIYYHVYHHGNAEDNLFREKDNYRFFMKKYAEYLDAYVDTFAYCLMPNHVHFLVRIKTKDEILASLDETASDEWRQKLSEQLDSNYSLRISNQFSHFLNSYAKAFNKRYNRIGSLFRNNINRKPITNKAYYQRVVQYIHANPVHHGFVQHPADWPYSSYHTILSEDPTWLRRETVREWFANSSAPMSLHTSRPFVEEQHLFE
ncbi:MAG: hypothetical protein EAZ89_16875 [Bacteroidetes bacterium]|nr:MAG: hypothetical protein EAZ89_16875 [Bacteroidota bacterium]